MRTRSAPADAVDHDGGFLAAGIAGRERFLRLHAGHSDHRAVFQVSVASRCTDQLLFGLLSRLPGGHIGESHYEPDFTVEPVPVSVDAMSRGLHAEVRRQLDTRTRVAEGWRAGLAGIGGLTLPEPAAGTRAAYLRFPVLVTDAGRRSAAIARLAEARFGYVQSYPGTLASIGRFRDICSSRPTPGADETARRALRAGRLRGS